MEPSRSLVGSVHVIIGLALVVLVMAGCLDPGPSPQQPITVSRPVWVASNLRSIPVALHVHALSNHNGRLRPGSMQWNAAEASTAKIEAIFWTEHLGIYAPFSWPIRWSEFQVGADDLTLVRTSPPPLDLALLVPHVSNGTVPVEQIGSLGLTMGVVPESGSTSASDGWNRFLYEFLGVSQSLVQNIGFARPIGSGVRLNMIVRIDSVDATHQGEVGFLLAYHLNGRAGQHRVLFEFAASAAPDSVLDSSTVEVFVPVIPGTRQGLTLDVLEAARHLPNGGDNTISRMWMEVRASNGGRNSMTIDSLSLSSTSNAVGSNYRHEVELALQYGAEYNLGSFVAGEYSPAWPHLNGFTPDWQTDSDVYAPDSRTPAEFASDVHAHGGIVSLNHILGLNSPNSSEPPPVRDLAVMDSVLDVRAYGADVLEVGYILRAGATLSDYFAVWDGLRANGLPLCGDGVSDGHGGDWKNITEMTNPVATYVWAPTRTIEDILGGIRSCRMYFGDYRLWSGEVDLKLGDSLMGSTIHSVPDSLPLTLYVSPILPGAKYFLVQGLARLSRVDSLSSFVARRRPVQPNTVVWVDTRRSGFVRAEAYAADGEFLFATNPVEFWH